MNDRPLVSIVTPCLNPGPLLKACIQNVQSQTYPLIEHIVIDGGSTDGTIELLQGSGVRWVSEPDEGQTAALVKGFELAKGSILSWLNADDSLLPDATEIAAKTISFSGPQMVYGCVEVIEPGRTYIIDPPPLLTADALAFGNRIPQPGSFFTAEAYSRVGGLRAQFNLAMDFDLWIRFAIEGIKGQSLGRKVARFEIHEKSKSGTIGWDRFVMEEFEALFAVGLRESASLALGRAAAHRAKKGSLVPRLDLQSEIRRCEAIAAERSLPIAVVRTGAITEAALIELQGSLRGLRYLANITPWINHHTRARLMLAARRLKKRTLE